jgi:hypothetical protein
MQHGSYDPCCSTRMACAGNKGPTGARGWATRAVITPHQVWRFRNAFLRQLRRKARQRSWTLCRRDVHRSLSAARYGTLTTGSTGFVTDRSMESSEGFDRCSALRAQIGLFGEREQLARSRHW